MRVLRRNTDGCNALRWSRTIDGHFKPSLRMSWIWNQRREVRSSLRLGLAHNSLNIGCKRQSANTLNDVAIFHWFVSRLIFYWINERSSCSKIKQGAEWTESRVNRKPSEQEAEWTRSRVNRKPNEQKAEWTGSRVNRKPSEQEAEWTGSRVNRKQSELTVKGIWLSDS